jgi:L-iditol 2-dehydrogenase
VQGLTAGQKVTALPQLVCGRCPPCRRGEYHICQALKVQGFQADGVAQELFVTDAEKVVPLPQDFSFEQGALVEPAAVAVHAVRRAGELAGRNVAVLGAGPIGNLTAQAARMAGGRVLITDLSDYRLDVAGRCGIENVSNASGEPLAEAAGRVFGAAGFDAAFECVGVTATLAAAVEHVNKGGIIVVVGVFAEPAALNVGLIQDRELTLRGTLMYRKEDYQHAVAAIAAGRIATQPLISRHFDFDDYLQAYRFIQRAGAAAMKVFIDL